MGLPPGTRLSRRPALQVLSDRLVMISWRGGLPHALSRDGSPSRDRPSRRPALQVLSDRFSRYPGGAGSRTPCAAMGLHPRTRPSRRPALQVLSDRLVAISWRGGLPHALSHHGSPSQDRPSGKPEAIGLRRASPLSPGAERPPRSCIRKNADCPPGLRNSHEFRYSSDAKRSRRPLDCGEHRRSLPARSALPATAFARMQTARQDFGTLTSSATPATLSPFPPSHSARSANEPKSASNSRRYIRNACPSVIPAT